MASTRTRPRSAPAAASSDTVNGSGLAPGGELRRKPASWSRPSWLTTTVATRCEVRILNWVS